MALVPAALANSTAKLDTLAVQIDPAQRRLAQIQTAPVERGAIEITLHSVGAIAIDESRQATIAAYIDGRLERLFADYTGVDIKEGDHLAVIYSPPLFAAQVEYLEARRSLTENNSGLAAVRQAQQALVANTKQRLSELGMLDAQIAELEKSGQAQSRLTIYSPQAGTVVEKLAIEGKYVKAGDPIYRIAELSTVWLMLKLFPEDAAKVRFGQRVDASVQSLPGERWIGRVAFIDPVVDPKTRTVGVRVELLNEAGRLRPGDYAEAYIRLPVGPQGQAYDAHLAGKWISPMHPQIIRDEPGACPICGMDLVSTARFGYADQPVPQPESLSVPRSAVLLAGGQSVVYVETKPGRFEIRLVTLGPILHDKIVILSGLQVGEQVATAGNFLIDSQMQLAGKPSLIDSSKARAASTAGPLRLSVQVTPIAGAAGEQLEQAYRAYFQVQAALAADKVPSAVAVQQLLAATQQLAQAPAISAESQKRFAELASGVEHLHHLELPAARQKFKLLSQQMLTLAAQLRGQGAKQPFLHFYCPMVPQGGGDWMQTESTLVNPYFGSEMLHCGEQIETLPVAGAAPQAQPQSQPEMKEKGHVKGDD